LAVANDILAHLDVEDEEAKSAIENFKTILNDPDLDLTVGTHLEGDSEFVTALNDMISATGMTKE